MAVSLVRNSVGLAGFPALLLERALINNTDLHLAERHALREQMSLADSVVALGLVEEGDAYAALAEAGGFALAALDGVIPSELALRLVPERIARRYLAVPQEVDNRNLTYATSQPFNHEAERDIAFASGRHTKLVVATRTAVLEALDRGYPKLRELDLLANRLRSESTVETDLADAVASDSVVINLCNSLIGRAVDVGASDIHLECGNTATVVRYRICGVLETVLTLPAAASQPIRNRFKILARADITIRHKPQDGAFRLKVNSRPIDVRLSSMPTVDGEKLVMRVIDSHSPCRRSTTWGTTPTRWCAWNGHWHGPTAWCWSPVRPGRARPPRCMPRWATCAPGAPTS